jgi:hypothetical protein
MIAKQLIAGWRVFRYTSLMELSATIHLLGDILGDHRTRVTELLQLRTRSCNGERSSGRNVEAAKQLRWLKR